MDNKKLLTENVKVLDVTHHIELFHILSRHRIHYSQNTNGVFIDMNDVNTSLLQELENYVSFAQNHPSNLDIKDKTSNDIKENDINDTKLLPQNETINLSIQNDIIVGSNPLESTKDVLLEKEKQSKQNKKNENKFIAAKKKYSKQVLTETKDI